jgi:uncharacterized protein (TIGR00299 family) protein
VTTAWFQCLAGAAGDMMLGALIDAGAPIRAVREAVEALGVEPIAISPETVTRGGLPATKIHVRTAETMRERTWPDVRDMLERATLPSPVRALAVDAFARLARAEATVHRVPPERVHFHEVGALDALADIVGTCAAMHALGISRAVGSAVTLGSGQTRGRHGPLPVPAPATLAVLAEAGAPVRSGSAGSVEVPHEMCTPTGAALLAATCTAWGEMPTMRVTAVGVGAGDRDLADLPNVLRVVLGEPVDRDESGDAVLIEANVDDLDPRVWPDVLARLLGAGAADAWLTPILMKKGRPAHTLSVLAGPDQAAALRRLVFTETSTIGLRERRVAKYELSRDFDTISVDGQQIRVKLAWLDGHLVNTQPEYDDVAAAARALDRPVKAVLAQAVAVLGGLRPTLD